METNKKKIFTVFLALGALSTVSSPRTDAVSQNLKDSVVAIPKPLPKSTPEPALPTVPGKSLSDKLDVTQMLINRLKEANDKSEQKAEYWKRIAVKSMQEANVSVNKARYDSLVIAEQNEVEALDKRDSIILPEACLILPEVTQDLPKKRSWFYWLFH